MQPKTLQLAKITSVEEQSPKRLFNMKLGVVMVAIVSIWDFIFMLLGLNLVLYIVGYLYILYITLSRSIYPVFLV